ncbi:YbhB/YbcL family Raf kinase inhibitor-like protein [Anoxybacterium hadale]|uniref:YbhB/YbcL family Raf kinase inhibitor-like protein n=1 Tax=Anoxybacterium hadale TaxID=3408580 RepID=A0ACD1A7N7_9FIRM|nr:YbhB/YbcL family Raf kinase inhibitor-like protein [Clostridiales bacterium]
MQPLTVKSNAFEEGGLIPIRYTARGEDLSPDFELEGIVDHAESIAITCDDASHPLFPNYNHWVIWNIPVQEIIKEGIPRGATVDSLGGAIQGIAYGRNRYKGPKPPLNAFHTYVFTVYVLDCKIDLSPKSRKRDLLNQMEGHILQQATLLGKFKNR